MHDPINSMSQPEISPLNSARAKLVFVGIGWFPTSPGGNERYVYELTHQLAADGDVVELCTVGIPNGEKDPALMLTNLCEEDWSFFKRLQQTRRNFAHRQIQDADAINIHFPLYGLPLLPILPPEIPVTFTFHGPWALESQAEGANSVSVGLKKMMEHWVYRRMTRFIVLSRAFGTVLHETYGVSWENIHVIPGGVDVHRFSPSKSQSQARDSLNWPRDRFILFTPRRLVNRMGIDKLIKAMVQLVPSYPDLWLAIAGKGVLREELEQAVQDAGLSNIIQFLGFLPDEDLPTAYQAADLTVIPSQSLEGFGLILLESLACGTPVACTPVGGMPEVLQGFAPDLIMPGTETDAIAHTLDSVLSNRLTLPTPEACRAYVTQNYDWRNISQQVRSVLLKPML